MPEQRTIFRDFKTSTKAGPVGPLSWRRFYSNWRTFLYTVSYLPSVKLMTREPWEPPNFMTCSHTMGQTGENCELIPVLSLHFIQPSCTIMSYGTYGSSNNMEIIIDIEDSVPLFAQLVMQIKEAVLNNDLSPGDSLPSIRQLANDLELNNKTVAKAYRLLERDSVIQTKGYRGTFIHPQAKANSKVDLNAWVTSKLDETIAAFRESGVTDSEIRIAFGNVLNKRNFRQFSGDRHE
jgi:GntR family transcriptional regulator